MANRHDTCGHNAHPFCCRRHGRLRWHGNSDECIWVDNNGKERKPSNGEPVKAKGKHEARK